MHGDINGIVISLGTIESIIKLKVINKTGKRVTKYLLLTGTEFEVRTTSYRTIYGPSAKRAGHKSKRTYSMDREDEVNKIFIISLSVVCLTGSGAIFYSRVTALNF